MPMHPSTFEYHQPNNLQLAVMNVLRRKFTDLTADIEAIVPDGPDKTYAIRKIRDAAMWLNVAITRHPDGSPR